MDIARRPIYVAAALGIIVPVLLVITSSLLTSSNSDRFFFAYTVFNSLVLMIWPAGFAFFNVAGGQPFFSWAYLFLLLLSISLNVVLYVGICSLGVWMHKRFKYLSISILFPLMAYWIWIIRIG